MTSHADAPPSVSLTPGRRSWRRGAAGRDAAGAAGAAAAGVRAAGRGGPRGGRPGVRPLAVAGQGAVAVAAGPAAGPRHSAVSSSMTSDLFITGQANKSMPPGKKGVSLSALSEKLSATLFGEFKKQVLIFAAPKRT